MSATDAAAMLVLAEHPLDLCACGDYRRDHPGNGPCRLNGPNDACHGFRDCLSFRLSARAAMLERGG